MGKFGLIIDYIEYSAKALQSISAGIRVIHNGWPSLPKQKEGPTTDNQKGAEVAGDARKDD